MPLRLLLRVFDAERCPEGLEVVPGRRHGQGAGGYGGTDTVDMEDLRLLRPEGGWYTLVEDPEQHSAGDMDGHHMVLLVLPVERGRAEYVGGEVPAVNNGRPRQADSLGGGCVLVFRRRSLLVGVGRGGRRRGGRWAGTAFLRPALQ